MLRKDKTKHPNYGNFKRKTFTCLNCNKINNIHQKGIKKYCDMKCKLEYIERHPEISSNYKGGKFINCLYCNEKKWVVPSLLKIGQGNYCSSKCYLKDPLSPNRKFGNDNPMANPKHREKIRNSIINHVMKYGTCQIGKNEDKILDYIEQKFNINIKRRYRIGGYVVDGYVEEKNIIIEVDEKGHLRSRQQQKDIDRQLYLENTYGCKFIRIRDYIQEDLYNAAI
jgi:hypothetical protein